MLGRACSELSRDPERTPPSLGLPGAAPGDRLVRVWVVDDNDGFREVLLSLLGPREGIQCEQDFACAETALAALDREPPPDVILLDVNLGDRNGADAVQPIRARAPATRVLMLTTFFDPKAHAKALGAGASGFLLKSYSLKEIAARVRQAPGEPLTGKVAVPAHGERAAEPEGNRAAVTGPVLLSALPQLDRGRAPRAAKRQPQQMEPAAPSRGVLPFLRDGLNRLRSLLNAIGPLFTGPGVGR